MNNEVVKGFFVFIKLSIFESVLKVFIRRWKCVKIYLQKFIEFEVNIYVK